MIYLQQPSLVSAMGDSLKANIDFLLSNQPHPLQQSQKWIENRSIFVGNTPNLQDLPENTAEIYRTRNNQLLWTAVLQLDAQIRQAIKKYGKDRIAVIIGTTNTGNEENVPAFQQHATQQNWQNSNYCHEFQLLSSPADFIAVHYGLTGPSYSISTACTSGARAIISAERLLKADLCDVVICGGVDSLAQLAINGFHTLEALSQSVANPFSANRDGINIGEGAAVFLATREPNGLPLLGYGSSSDAYHMSAPIPDGSGAISAISTALSSAGIAEEQIGWVNLHGTGTVHNDAMESTAMAHCFPQGVPCTGTKALTGHTLGAAGAVEAAILWGIISREFNPEGKLPKQHWDNQPDTNLPAIQLTDEHSRWAENRPRIGLSSSFAFGGNNVILVIGETECSYP
ncbi:3-oxoacyl-[acyl-carrier-protein] synthase-1 [Cricetibacter osteomyelitidis]|uniref:3-oxoacyl-[acyl-carrier-protein] synthase-1 n=1 Tax=Cricetibacter osteomyelitidis TaxID=1521931 RepID=A0A4R2T274_9PAST|nr:beta-ketoacyl-ACP synthase [Cricetibacter osteomyelitidis]TCP94904.1 3-oxoacyl-[acyl-carrier-protein] synthase-1 [Cricetibacter osteomyelitidis]